MPVYFIESGPGGPIKVGYLQPGRSLEGHLKSLQRGNPEALRLLVISWSAGRESAQELSRAFAAASRGDGWFEPTQPLQEFIRQLSAQPEDFYFVASHNPLTSSLRRPGRTKRGQAPVRAKRRSGAPVVTSYLPGFEPLDKSKST